MDKIIEYFGGVDWKSVIVIVFVVFNCAVPLVQLFKGNRPLNFTKEEQSRIRAPFLAEAARIFYKKYPDSFGIGVWV